MTYEQTNMNKGENMISETEYKHAVENRDKAQETINLYLKQKIERFDERMKTNPIFTEDELRFSAQSRCPCGAGLAYPTDCGMHHYWDCSAILMGTEDKTVPHTAKLPFAFYDVKSESSHRGTTRPSGVPKE